MIPVRMCVADLEADGLLNEATRVWCGVFKDVNTGETREFGPDEVPDMLRFMETVDILIIHNGTGYDHPLLQKLYGYVYKGVRVDTLLMSRLQRPERKLPFNCPDKKLGPHSIGAWGYRVGRGKPDHNEWDRYSPEMLHRCREDVEILALVYQALREEGGPEWRSAHQLTHKLFDILHQQEEYGWLVDQYWMHRSIDMLNYWIDKIDRIVVPMLPPVLEIKENKKAGEYLYVKKPYLISGRPSQSLVKWMDEVHIPTDTRIVGGPFSRVNFRAVNLNSNEEVKDWLLREGWEPEQWNYKKAKDGRLVRGDDGQLIRTSPKLNGDDAFNGVNGGVGSLIARRVQCRHRRSQIEGWIKNIRPDGRLSQGIAGLTTTSRLRHKVLVNVPGEDAFFGKWMRKCFICKPGYKLVGVDVEGCQARMLAARIGDPNYTKTIIEGDKSKGTSIHQVNQRAIAQEGINVTYKQSKNLQYAFLFGAQDPKLGTTIGKGQAEGVRIRRALLGVAPGFEEVVNGLVAEWRANAQSRINRWGKTEYYNGWLRGLDGRPVFVSKEPDVLVFTLQSDEAILVQTALVLLKGWLDDRGWTFGNEYGIVGQAHDEWTAEVRQDLAEEYRILAEEAVAQAGINLGIDCPQEGSGAIGDTWYDIH